MAYTYPKTPPFWQAVKGFFDYADVYQDLVNGFQDGDCFVELGCYMGKSACFIGELIKTSGKKVTILCVDTWPSSYRDTDLPDMVESPYESFYANVRQSGLTKFIIPIRATTDWASTFVKDGLAAVFVDADHSYESCLKDIKLWRPKVRKGGVLAGHDYSGTFPGVQKAVNESFKTSEITIKGQTWIYRVP